MSFTPLRAAWSRQSSIASALKQREERWMEIIRDGQAPFSEVMKADFGHANPNRLNINHWAGDPVIEFGFGGTSKRFLASASLEKPEVYLHEIFAQLKNLPTFPLRGQAVSVFSHETIHSRQGLELQIGLTSVFGNFLYGLEVETPKNQAKIDRITKRTKFLSAGKYDLEDYLADNIEVQARLHEALCIAYQEWQMLPINREEFFAAMHCLGFNIPQETIKGLQDSKNGIEALKQFRLTDYTKTQAWVPVALLNSVFSVAELSGKTHAMWEEDISYIYGHLLSLYGDEHGFTRLFDAEPSRIPLLQTLQNIKANPSTVNISEAASKIPDVQTGIFLWGIRNQEQSPEMIRAFEAQFSKEDRLSDWYEPLGHS